MSDEDDEIIEPSTMARRRLLGGASQAEAVSALMAETAWVLDDAATSAIVQAENDRIENGDYVSKRRMVSLYQEIHRRSMELGDAASLRTAKTSLDAIRELQEFDD
jgi:hypothetical protein